MNQRSGGDDRGKIITLDFDALAALDDDFVCVRLHRRTRDMLLSISDYLTWRTRYIHSDGSNIRADETEVIDDIKAWGDQAKNELMADDECLDFECEDYSVDSSYTDIQPANPFVDPDYVPAGWAYPPFWILTTDDIIWTALGLLQGDMITDLGRFPGGAFPPAPITSGLARFRVYVMGEWELEIHMVGFPSAGYVWIQKNDNPLTLETYDLNVDILNVPPEIGEVTIWQWNVEGSPAVEQWVDVTFIPSIGDELIPFRYGGGIRKITICKEEIELAPEFRLNGERLEWRRGAGTSWIDLGDIVPKPIITAERTGADVEIFYALETNPGATTLLATLSDGVPGADGADGVDGADGLPGADGECLDCPDVDSERCRAAGGVGLAFAAAAALMLYELQAQAPNLDVIDPSTYDPVIDAYTLLFSFETAARDWLIERTLDWATETVPAPATFDDWVLGLIDYAENQLQAIQCGIYRTLPTDGVYITSDVVQDWADELPATTPGGADLYAYFFSGLLLQTSPVSLASKITESIYYPPTDFNCADCDEEPSDCPEGYDWCYVFDFTLVDGFFTYSNGPWTGGTIPSWQSGTGWIDGLTNRGTGGESLRTLLIGRLMPAMPELTYVRMDTILDMGTNVPSYANVYRISDDGTILATTSSSLSGSLLWEGTRNAASRNWYFGGDISYRNDGSTPNGDALITKIEFRGMGTMPVF